MGKSVKKKVLFFANIPIRHEERSIGGATVLAENILEFINSEKQIDVFHKQIRRFWRNKLQIIDYALWLIKFPFVILDKDVVSIHGTKDLHFTIGPILCLWAKLLNKKTVYHFFGGNFHKQYEKLPKTMRWFYRKTILNCDTVFFETKFLVDYFNDTVKSVEWLPNARKPIIRDIQPRPFEKKFVFISRIIPQKGINELIQAANLLDSSYTVDVYGPIDSRHYKENIFENTNINYKGILKPEEVTKTLATYNYLLLPSYFEGEGYSGIIIESLALGIPVITTKWQALPEIITHGYNGILIDIKAYKQLYDAIISINTANYINFQKNTLESFKNFNSDVVFNRLIKSYLK